MKKRLIVNGDYMRGAREALGLTQAALGEKVGVTESWIANIEGGKSPSVEMAIKLSEVLGVPARNLIDFELVEETSKEETSKGGTPDVEKTE